MASLSDNDITTLCPRISDPTNEKEILNNFQLYLARKTSDCEFEKINLLDNDDLLHRHFKRYKSPCCLLVSLVADSPLRNTGSVVCVESERSLVSNNGLVENRISVDVKPVVVSVTSKKSVLSETRVLYPLAKVNYFSSASKNVTCTSSIAACDFSASFDHVKFCSRQRQESVSSICEVSTLNSSVKIKHSVSENRTAPARTGRNRKFGIKLRQKLFGERRSKTVPENVGKECIVEQLDWDHSSRPHKSKSASNGSFRHPCVRFSTRLSFHD